MKAKKREEFDEDTWICRDCIELLDIISRYRKESAEERYRKHHNGR